jgi:hypothetical protein
MSEPMTCDELAERLAEFLDGSVDEAMREGIAVHAASCTECSALLADLRRLRTAAAALPVLVPSRDLWSGVASRIETPVVELNNAHVLAAAPEHVWHRRVWIGLAAAGLVAVTATVTQQMTARSMAPRAAAVPAATVATIPVEQSSVQFTSVVARQQAYDQEIARLRDVLDKRRPQLDSATVAVVEHNLAVIDEAIAQCAQALRKDPASRFLVESLNDALETKVQLLKRAASLSTQS